MKKKLFSVRGMVMCALFTALLAAGAFIKIPMPLVPMTLQAQFALLAGVLLRRARRSAFRRPVFAARFVRLACVYRRRRNRLCAASDVWVYHRVPGGGGCRRFDRAPWFGAFVSADFSGAARGARRSLPHRRRLFLCDLQLCDRAAGKRRNGSGIRIFADAA